MQRLLRPERVLRPRTDNPRQRKTVRVAPAFHVRRTVLSPRNPDHINCQHGQDAQSKDRKTTPAPGAKSKKRNHTCNRTDDEEDGRHVDDPEPYAAGIEAFVKIIQPAQGTAVFLLDFTPAVNPVNRDHGAGTWGGKRHLYLIGVVVVIR